MNILYTIGHSTHDINTFVAMLQSFAIQTLADIRRLPGSRKYPQFNQDNLAQTLALAGIAYVYLADLGGRRRMNRASHNTRWRNASFQAYADHMETEVFERGIDALTALAKETATALMCAEAVWWRCHRSLISDCLKARGWTILHITGIGKAKEHPYISPAIIVGDKVVYTEPPGKKREPSDSQPASTPASASSSRKYG